LGAQVNASAVLLLADARFPAGGHAHSGGVEPAATAGTVTDLASLELFLRGRLRTAGMTAAGLAAAACALAAQATPAAQSTLAAQATPASQATSAASQDTWDALDAEADARMPSPAQREASRRQGRALLRAARAAWPGAPWLSDLGRQPHHAIMLGAAAHAAGCTPLEAARIAAYQAVGGPASAAVRLLALDPMQAAAITARLAAEIDQTATRAADHATSPPADLPCPSSPALDLLAQAHARAEVRLFES
jgi:urease accessory protein